MVAGSESPSFTTSLALGLSSLQSLPPPPISPLSGGAHAGLHTSHVDVAYNRSLSLAISVSLSLSVWGAATLPSAHLTDALLQSAN